MISSPRQAALAAGEQFYCTGVPCGKGHNSPRLARTADCFECFRLRKPDSEVRAASRRAFYERRPDYQKDRRAKDPEKDRQRCADYLAGNRERNRERCANYRIGNLDREKVRRAQWLRAHPDEDRAHTANRRAMKAKAPGRHSAQDLLDIKLNQLGRCFYCGVRTRRGGHFDHYIPLSKGGSNAADNLRWACAKCNTSKRDKVGADFEAWLAKRAVRR